MKILGLDMATKTGWCLYDASTKKIIESGVQTFEKRRGESNGLNFLRFRRWLHSFVAGFKPNLIAYERAHYRGGAATELCVGFQTRAQEVAAEFEIESMPVATTTLKKFATGKGNADKAAMIAKAHEVIGIPPIDDNEADAVCVAVWAASEIYAGETL
jgi:Holliday junction resolvasome RuvABC endonuclease subunit